MKSHTRAVRPISVLALSVPECQYPRRGKKSGRVISGHRDMAGCLRAEGEKAQAGPSRHLLGGFPHAALSFFRALEANRAHAASRFGLSEMDLRALFRIAEAGRITPKTLAADLLVTTGAVTGVGDRLISAGLVT